MKNRIISLSIFTLLVFACSPKTVTTASTPKSTTKIELSSDLLVAKKSYENNCAKCHKLYNSKDFTAQEWKPILERMQPKAEISDQERDKIYAYLTMN